MIQTKTFAEVSTCHIDEATAQVLDEVAEGTRNDLCLTVLRDEYRYVVLTWPSEIARAKAAMPAPLKAVLDFVELRGVYDLILDRDADPVEGLPVYDW
ncbi:hypothetical protein RM531_08260 [Salinisphaera sp. P385]|uniref:DUF5983 domain-containing protein n=1 Tax=Spectribacter acetivorans TaxID=3075603 RepID=A0ABU3B8H4_9GAMM|nr:hypothetical protein [Salinisphaera sp. P385]MDT0618468.1 hypothetical protein [Salinisphaera sp. P385]